MYEDKFEPYKRYIEENKTRIGLFVRPAINNFTITLANKNVAIKFDLLLLNTDLWELSILDKISGEEKIIKSRMSLFEMCNKSKLLYFYHFLYIHIFQKILLQTS